MTATKGDDVAPLSPVFWEATEILSQFGLELVPDSVHIRPAPGVAHIGPFLFKLKFKHGNKQQMAAALLGSHTSSNIVTLARTLVAGMLFR
jgi:hypothetical protein